MITLPRSLSGPRTAALVTIAFLVAASTLVAFGESYRGLYLWAARHDLPAGWALVWPAMIDVFVMVGELALFVALTDRWSPKARRLPWAVTLIGLAVSVAGNIGHVSSPIWTTRATAAVPPIAAAACLMVGLAVLKRVVEAMHDSTGETGPDPAEASHLAVLANAETDAQRVRYAAAVTASAEVGPVGTWLADRGYSIPDTNIMSVLRRATDRQADLSRRVVQMPDARVTANEHI